MQPVSNRAQKIQDDILSSDYALFFLIWTAKLFAEPALFYKKCCEKRLLTRYLAPFGLILFAANSLSFLMTQMISMTPQGQNIDLQMPLLVFDFVIYKYSITIESIYVVNYAIILGVYSCWWYLVQSFIVRKSKQLGKPLHSVMLTYFTLKVCNIALWLAAVGVVGVWVMYSMTAHDWNQMLVYAEAHSWQLLLFFAVVSCVNYRIDLINKRTAQQLYPTLFYKVLAPPVVLFSPLFAVLFIAL
ncbi:hypothetical protein [Halodesulfovibrio aestuarii]|uniref:hypothetical protein n=1 Tax=Halodesulfovibrio aestuarii TaxID=126333 RepID=UPI00041C50FA